MVEKVDWWAKDFQYLLNRKILSRDEFAYLLGQIKSVVTQESNKSFNEGCVFEANALGRERDE